ncbi:unnamed protein product [Closterium sp. Yama58-4]|nr:unnamed protein product [Closterium sp. Yama58-4]
MAPEPQVVVEGAEGASVNPQVAAVKASLAKVSESFQAAIAQQRPWAEVVDRSQIAKPEGFNDAVSRIRKNIVYFKANYLAIILGMVALSILWNPVSIFWLGILGAAWVYLFMIHSQPLVIGGRVLSETEKLLGMIAISVLVIFGLTKVGSVLMSGVTLGLVAIAIHASLRVPDDLFIDQGPAPGSYMSFLGGINNPQPVSVGV